MVKPVLFDFGKVSKHDDGRWKSLYCIYQWKSIFQSDYKNP